MFSIIINQAIQECAHMEKMQTQLSYQLIELEQAIRELRGLSGMDEPLSRLEQLRASMEGECTMLRQMLLALNKTILSYLSCENRICDNGEQNVIFYVKQETGINDLSEIANILSGI